MRVEVVSYDEAGEMFTICMLPDGVEDWNIKDVCNLLKMPQLQCMARVGEIIEDFSLDYSGETSIRAAKPNAESVFVMWSGKWKMMWFQGKEVGVPDMDFKQGVVEYLVNTGVIAKITFSSKKRNTWKRDINNKDLIVLDDFSIDEDVAALARNVQFSDRDVITLPTTFLGISGDQPEIEYTNQTGGIVYDDFVSQRGLYNYRNFDEVDKSTMFSRDTNGAFYGIGNKVTPTFLKNFPMPKDTFFLARIFNVTFTDFSYINWMSYTQESGIRKSGSATSSNLSMRY